MSRMKKKEYEELLEPLKLDLNNIAHWLQKTAGRMVVLVEGRDTAGKGGCVGAIADNLNPRQARIVALPKPTDREQSQWYFQRYVQHLPAAGEMVLSEGGAKLAIDGKIVHEEPEREYPSLYHRFSEIVRAGYSDVDLAPLTHVADAFMLGRRKFVDTFYD